MAMKYEGQEVRNIAWDNNIILQDTPLVKITVSATNSWESYENVLTLKYEAIQGEPGDIIINATRRWGEVGGADNSEEKTYTLSSKNPTLTYNQSFGSYKYSPFDYLILKTATNKGNVQWTINSGEVRGTTNNYAIIPAYK